MKLGNRKPTTTDTTTNFFFNHPTEHKMAAYRYHINKQIAITSSNNRKTTSRMGDNGNHSKKQ